MFVGLNPGAASATAPATPSSLEEFEEKYAVVVNEGTVSIVERVNQQAVATFELNPKIPQQDERDPSHFNSGTYYFILSSEERNPRRTIIKKIVYSFELAQRSIKCVLGPLNDPHFIDQYLVHFGTGFNAPGPQYLHTPGFSSEITLYDLTRPRGQKVVKTIYLENTPSQGFEGSIDYEAKAICAFNCCRGDTQTYLISDLVIRV